MKERWNDDSLPENINWGSLHNTANLKDACPWWFSTYILQEQEIREVEGTAHMLQAGWYSPLRSVITPPFNI